MLYHSLSTYKSSKMKETDNNKCIKWGATFNTYFNIYYTGYMILYIHNIYCDVCQCTVAAIATLWPVLARKVEN